VANHPPNCLPHTSGYPVTRKRLCLLSFSLSQSDSVRGKGNGLLPATPCCSQWREIHSKEGGHLWRFLHTSSFPVAGWWSVRDPEAVINDRLDLKRTAAALEVGCPHFAGIFALGGALSLFERIGAVQIEQRIHELTDYLHQRLDEEGVRVASPRMRDQRSGITIIEMRKAPDVVKSLAEKKIIVSARRDGLRVSLRVFNNFDDIEHLVAALRELPFLVTRIAR